MIPFLEDGKPIQFTGFKGSKKFAIFGGAPRTGPSASSRVKQPPNLRPLMRLPWSLRFDLILWENAYFDEKKLKNWIDAGGLMVGLCNYRPRFGRYALKAWDVK